MLLSFSVAYKHLAVFLIHSGPSAVKILIFVTYDQRKLIIISSKMKCNE